MERRHAPPPLLVTPEFRADLDQCIHCGLCLQACPTYVTMGREADSPRGRIVLMRAAADGRVALDGSAFEEHIDLCLDCRACETACPSGVRYGSLVETARIALAQSRTPSAAGKLVRWIGLNQMMPHRDRLRLMGRAMRLYQIFGLQKLVRKVNLLPQPLKQMEAILPPVPKRYPNYGAPAPAMGPQRGTVAFFYGCIQDAFLAEVNEATLRVLQRNGYVVKFPGRQTCCGAAQLHTGDIELARRLARQNIDTFLAGGYDAFLNNAGGCGATLKEYANLLADDQEYRDKARLFVARVQDVGEFLAAHLNDPPRGQVKARVTYAESCHLRHAQKVVNAPRDLIRAIPGVVLVELSSPERCCGSAGIYNLVQIDAANAILDSKMDDIAASGADTIVISNTGCHMQLLYGVRRAGLRARVAHYIELLDESYRNENGGKP